MPARSITPGGSARSPTKAEAELRARESPGVSATPACLASEQTVIAAVIGSRMPANPLYQMWRECSATPDPPPTNDDGRGGAEDDSLQDHPIPLRRVFNETLASGLKALPTRD